MKRFLFAGALAFVLASPTPVLAVYGGTVETAANGRATAFITLSTRNSRGSCTGVLIASNKVLTAAHCLRTSRGKKRRVRRVRIGNPKGKTVRARVRSTHVHPKFNPARPELGYDFAVIILRRAVSQVQPIALAAANEDASPGTKVTIRGFGLTPKGRRLVPSKNVLRSVRLEALSPYACFSGQVKEMAKTRLCAAHPKAGVCPGDSGSAVTRRIGKREVVVGTVSVVLDSGRCKAGPAIIGRTSAVRDWVSSLAAK